MTKQEYMRRLTQIKRQIGELEEQIGEMHHQYNSELPFQPGDHVMIQIDSECEPIEFVMEGFAFGLFDAFIVRRVYPNKQLAHCTTIVYDSDKITKI